LRQVNQQAGVQSMDRVNFPEKFARFTEPWKPKAVGELNGQQMKLDKFRGQGLRSTDRPYSSRPVDLVKG
jgi:hypothetical protein